MIVSSQADLYLRALARQKAGHMSSKLSDLHVGKSAVLDTFAVSPLHRKLLSMGLLPGQNVSVLRRLPLKGSLYVRIEDRHVALRYSEAQQIGVKL